MIPAWILRLPLRLEHRGVERLARGLAGPDHELEGREVALAGVERGSEQRLALPARGFDAAGQHQRVAVHDQAVLDPEIEMPDPQLLIDHRNELLHLAAAALRDLELEGAGEMQRLDVEHPGVGDLIVGPFAGHQDGDLVVAGALERPAIARCHPLDHVERIHARLFGKADQGHAVSTMPLGSGMRTRPHASHAALDAVPRWSCLTAPGRITCESNITPLIPAAKAQSDGMKVKDWWISRLPDSVLHRSGVRRQETASQASDVRLLPDP